MEDVYRRLQQRLDEMATGYPTTDSGVEIRVLKQLFSPDDAELFLKMNPDPETAFEVSSRIGGETGSIEARLEDMARRGLLFRQHKEGNTYYQAMPFVVGVYEFQVKNLYPSLLNDISEYYLSGFGKTFHSLKIPHMRSVPINQKMVSQWPIAPYDDAVAIIASKERIAVSECLCRKAVRTFGGGCDHPLETCLQFDIFADFYVDNGMARYITMDEARDILVRNEKAGLVIQTVNSRNVEAMCSCCSCCCGMLLSLNLFPSPAREVKSNYSCRVVLDQCSGCGTCVKRCPVKAVKLVDERAFMEADRCIGCGLCVSTCPQGVRKLVKKSRDKIYTPPETVFDTFVEMGAQREKI